MVIFPDLYGNLPIASQKLYIEETGSKRESVFLQQLAYGLMTTHPAGRGGKLT